MNNFRIFWALIQRDLLVLKKMAGSIFWDNIILLVTAVAVFGHLLPTMGMAPELIGPLFLGHIVMTCMQLANSMGFTLTRDLEFDRFIDYQVSLPFTETWLLTQYVTSFVIKAMMVSLPLLLCGVLLLGDKFLIIKTNWFAFGFMYLLVLIFFATLVLFFSFAYDYEWVRWNLWTRRIEPLFLFASVSIVWKKLYLFSQLLGILFLCNPLTYATEGLRTTLIGGDGFLPLWACILGVTIGIIINWNLLIPAMRKRLDLVQEIT